MGIILVSRFENFESQFLISAKQNFPNDEKEQEKEQEDSKDLEENREITMVPYTEDQTFESNKQNPIFAPRWEKL